ncbi:hypothetical protein V7S43_005521 [Phytophthora oleae]|uniref:REJ domain-containing protein n=1 Tax=Phytophthora oleae TaxID=2107226 RepID=A0ABD3FQC8_9STRA
MRTVADVSTDDLVNSLLNSVTSGASSTSTSDSTSSTSTTKTSAPSSASASESAASASASHSASSSSNDAASTKITDAPATASPATTAPPTSAPASASSSTGSGETATKGASEGSDSGGGGSGVGLSIGIAIGVLALVVAALLFLRSRRKRAQKARESAMSPPMGGATCLTVPADRGFRKEQELGMPEMSIELTPGELGMSKGFDLSYASSTRSSAASQPYNPSLASSTDSSVFNTKGGVSPTFSNRKMASYSYQYRESEESANMSSARSNDSTTFHLTGLIGNGATASGRGPSNAARAPGTRKLSAPDEYAELVTATNAHGHVDMNAQNQSPQVIQADFTQSATSQNDMDISMGPDNDNHSFLAPLPTRAAPAPVQTRQAPVVRASEESMGPDSPVAGRGKRTGSVYDTIPKLSGEKMSVSSRSSEEDPNAMSTASFLSESSISSTSTRDSAATSARGSAYVSSMPLLQQLSSADDSDYGEDYSSERASTESIDSANTTRSGSLIALNLEAKDGCSEIAI